MKLKISDELSLPDDACTQTFAFIARKGAGKTYGASKLAELLMAQNDQVVILDTVGNWYGLRIAADGKGKGFDIPVFGGLRGDIPLQSTAGGLVADVAVDTGRSMIIDISQFSLSERKRFATAFGEQLWKRKKAQTHPIPLMLMIEESQLIIPQFSGRNDAHMVGIYEEIIRLGRNYGIGCTMISQRPQSVNKEVLNQTECLFVLQVNGAQERKALKDWIVHQGMATDLLDELPSLARGMAYVWSPQWLGVLKKVLIAEKVTFDASSTPKTGGKTIRRNPAPLDLKEIEAQMAATIEQNKANDPIELRKKIHALENEVKKWKLMPTPMAAIKEVPAMTDAERKRLDVFINGCAEAEESKKELVATQVSLTSVIIKLIGEAQYFKNLLSSKLSTSPSRAAVPFSARPVAPAKSRMASPLKESQIQNGVVSRVGHKILGALAEMETLGANKPDREIVALLAGYTNLLSKGFVNAVCELRTGGYVNYPNSETIAFTEAGRGIATFPDAPMSSEEIQRRVCDLIGGKASEILRPLIASYPDSMERSVVAAEAGYTNLLSKGFVNAVSRLRTLGFVDYPDSKTIIATDILFLK